MIKEQTTFETDDGQSFKSFQKAREHEAETALKKIVELNFKAAETQKQVLFFLVSHRMKLIELLEI